MAAVGVFIVILVILSLSFHSHFLSVSASLASGDVVGDALEHWNVHPLRGEITLRSSPVQGLHIALYGEGFLRMTWLNPIQFMSGNFSFTPMCSYGITPTEVVHRVVGVAYTYMAGMFRFTLNTAVISLDVLPDTHDMIFYVCGDPRYGWSDMYSFEPQKPTIVNSAFKNRESIKHVKYHNQKTRQRDGVFEMIQEEEEITQQSSGGKKIVLIADMGVTHAADTMTGIQELVQNGIVKLVVHAGDISYADNFSEKKHNNSYIWVEYMNEIERFTPWVPYMTCPGNHEAQFDFLAYLNWLPMPYTVSGSMSPFWYSFDYMGVHFLSFSTEHNFNQSTEQFQFMKQDLIKANTKRDEIPWIVVIGHRPMYCTSVVARDRCLKEAPVYRSYLEDLFHDQKVDIYLCGHDHNYERTFPVYREKATQKDYNNPQATVYIVNGAAGNPEPNDPSYMHHIDWRAYVYASIDNGFLLAEPTQSELRFQYIRSKDRKVIDSFTLTKS